jgi:NAD(P)-dependent dehydrogenase (short-subunit alcohol dehydrogenase family)
MAYVWAKRGVQRLVQRDAIALGRRGARVCSLSPGIIDTPMGRQEAAARPTNDILVQHTPLGREGQPEEVAAAVAFLLSDEASFINGIDVPVDGGVVAAVRGARVGLG